RRPAYINPVDVANAAIPTATNPRLKNAIKELFQPRDKVSGGTAGILRDEIRMGQNPPKHLIKAQERAVQLQRILDQESLDANDRAVAQQLLDDLKNAIAGK